MMRITICVYNQEGDGVRCNNIFFHRSFVSNLREMRAFERIICDARENQTRDLKGECLRNMSSKDVTNIIIKQRERFVNV